MKGYTGFYCKYIKRILDIVISGISLLVLSPLLIVLTIIGFFKMKGNPFFYQKRPGKNEQIFGLIKFRTMSNERDKDGHLLPDSQRLNNYGKMLRKLSLDELPELINVIKGDMSLVGPRPLAVQYLGFYNETECKRHLVLPGLTGLAQINGRNCINWPERFAYDVEYVENVCFMLDISIVIKTVIKVVKRSDVAVRATGTIMDFDQYRMLENNGKMVNEHETKC